MVNPIEDLFRGIFAFLDCTIYTFISWAYELLMYLANLDLFGMTWSSNQSIIEQFSSRIYSLLAVFMLFRLAFSLLQYLVDPNKFYDEKRGVSTIVKHVMISLLLIVTVPMIFTQAFKIQQVILNSDVIGELILGESNSADKTDDNKEENNMSAEGVNHDMAVDMQFLVLGTFMSINTEAFPSCSDGPVLGTVSMALSNDGKCLQEVSTFLDSKQENINYFFPDSDEYANMSQYPRNIWKYYDIINLRQDGKYLIDYRPILSGITGIFIVILLFRFCIDIAIRVVKLGFLEIVAPIPIVAYMGPSDKESSMLSRWGKECFSTYFALFIRLAILFFAFYVIRILCDTFINVTGEDLGYLYMNGDAPSTGLMSMLVVVMVILGTLIFANQLPKLISKLFNTGEDALGGIGLSPMAQINSSKIAAGAIGTSIGAAAGAWSGYKAGKQAGAGGKGALVGMLSGVNQGFNSRGKLSATTFGDIRKSTYKTMTGNELASFNPLGWLLRHGSQGAIDEVGEPLDIARGQYRSKQAELSSISHAVGDIYSQMQEKGYREGVDYNARREQAVIQRDDARRQAAQISSDLSAANTSKNDNEARLNEAREKAKAAYDRMEAAKNGTSTSGNIAFSGGAVDDVRKQAKAEYEAAQADIARYEAASASDAQRVNDLRNQLNQANTQVTQSNSVISDCDDIITLNNRYADLTNKENEARGELDAIEKDIKILESEKAQRKRFYGIEDSPQQSVIDTKKRIKEREEKLGNQNRQL